jgi:hypothetical protein
MDATTASVEPQDYDDAANVILPIMLSTATKMRIARALSTTLLSIGFPAKQQVRRRGIAYEADLREGIDLSLYLFGAFQSHVLQIVRRLIPTNGIVLDVGANIGAITFPIAVHLDGGHVYAFEPTDFAYSKLARNLELNPNLASALRSQVFRGRSAIFG